MDWDVIAPMIVMVTGIVTTGGVLVLRPLSKRLAELLEALTQERRTPRQVASSAEIRELVASIDARLSLIEERQEFTEALLGAERRKAVPVSATARRNSRE